MRAGVRGSREASSALPGRSLARARPRRPPAAEPPTEHPVPEIEAVQVATLVTTRNGAWAALLPDGRSYKSAGDVSDVLWWAIKMVRFEAGELDPYDPSIHCLPHSQPIL